MLALTCPKRHVTIGTLGLFVVGPCVKWYIRCSSLAYAIISKKPGMLLSCDVATSYGSSVHVVKKVGRTCGQLPCIWAQPPKPSSERVYEAMQFALYTIGFANLVCSCRSACKNLLFEQRIFLGSSSTILVFCFLHSCMFACCSCCFLLF